MTGILLLPLVLAFTPPAVAQAPASDGPSIVTTGEGTVKLAPDRAWVSISAESRARGPKEAQRANADAMTAVLGKLKALGLAADAIRTSGYDLQPEFDYANGKQTLRGYVARNQVEVRIDTLAKTGDIITAAVGTGATNVSGVRFDVKDRMSLEREALRLAVRDARRRADAAASGADMAVDRVMRIEEQREMQDLPRPIMMASRAEMAQSAVPVEAGQIEVRSRVVLTAAIK